MTRHYTVNFKPTGINNRYAIARWKRQLILSTEYRADKETLSRIFRLQDENKFPFFNDCIVTIKTGLSRFDIDAHCKIILDALKMIAYRDDRQVVELHIIIDKAIEFIKIEVKEK
jgi:Holliday junction resolvase RusA-like endonuclease